MHQSDNVDKRIILSIKCKNIELSNCQMNLSALNTFLAIVDTGHLNRAAEHLNVTQSTVTARLNALEQEMGQTLFHRRKSGAELTSAGFRFERYAQLMVDVWGQAKQETALPSEIEAIFNLGCHPDLWPNLGETFFNWVRDSHENIAVSAWAGDQSDLDRWLASGLIDAALCYSPSHRGGGKEISVKSEPLVLVSTQPRERVRWDPKYVYVDAGEEFRKSHAAAYADSDTTTMTFGSAIWAKDYLINKGGSGYLPKRLIEKELHDGKFHRVADAPEFSRNVYLILNRDAENMTWLTRIIDDLIFVNSSNVPI